MERIKRDEEDKENVNSQVDHSTPVAEVHRSSRITRPPRHYSPALNNLLLIDSGELEFYITWYMLRLINKSDIYIKFNLYKIIGFVYIL